MNRRTFLTGTLVEQVEQPSSTAKAVASALDPFSGQWTDKQRKHLLHRTMFGIQLKQFEQASMMTLQEILDMLFSAQTLPSHPVAYLNTGNITAGNDWTAATYDVNQENVRLAFLQSWQISMMLNQPIRIHDKLMLFWQNHFATGSGSVKDARLMHKQYELLFNNVLGNFKSMVESIVLDPAMLRYLNGNTNSKDRPNENFARELQELFTIGKGPEIAPGNYTNYTEQDIKEAARILTGWSDNQTTQTAIFKSASHDTGKKTFSAAYKQTVIQSGGTTEAHAKQEVSALINMIFAQEATSLYITRKLYRFFVDYIIDESVETFVIQPLAKLLRESSFEIKPVLQTLFKSEHFYSSTFKGCFIKTPMDFVIGTSRLFEPALLYPQDQKEVHWAYRTLRRLMAQMGQDLISPPNVAGLPAYYQEPAYHELWINADTLQKRIKFIGDLSVDYLQLDEMAYGKGALIDVFKIVEWAGDPSDSMQIVEAWCDWFYAIDINAEVKHVMQRFLTGGLEDFVWTNEWIEWKNNPTEDKTKAIEVKLRTLLKYMLSMAEYQLA